MDLATSTFKNILIEIFKFIKFIYLNILYNHHGPT